ncbi:MAG: hypothetical protein KBD78_14810 [Oligoflexales bacterium]|nr:hypothetical protein [Oligoflexales bacterium]
MFFKRTLFIFASLSITLISSCKSQNKSEKAALQNSGALSPEVSEHQETVIRNECFPGELCGLAIPYSPNDSEIRFKINNSEVGADVLGSTEGYKFEANNCSLTVKGPYWSKNEKGDNILYFSKYTGSGDYEEYKTYSFQVAFFNITHSGSCGSTLVLFQAVYDRSSASTFDINTFGFGTSYVDPVLHADYVEEFKSAASSFPRLGYAELGTKWLELVDFKKDFDPIKKELLFSNIKQFNVPSEVRVRGLPFLNAARYGTNQPIENDRCKWSYLYSHSPLPYLLNNPDKFEEGKIKVYVHRIPFAEDLKNPKMTEAACGGFFVYLLSDRNQQQIEVQ